MDPKPQLQPEAELSEEGSEEPNTERILRVRLDKWLWAARFFKTRAVARAAVERGKVFYDGERSNPNREIEIGARIKIRLGNFEKTVIIKGLSTRRRSTEEALQLFEEAPDYPSSNNKLETFNVTTDKSYNSYSPARDYRPGRYLRRSLVRTPHTGERINDSKLNQPRVEIPDCVE